MKQFITTILLLSFFLCSGQSKIEKLRQQNVYEGKLLYQSEMASWHGTDLFLAKYKNRENIGGYLSYIRDKDKPTCIFFSKGEIPKVIGTITFDTTFNLQSAQIDLEERNLSNVEIDYRELRDEALTRIRQDTIFKLYQNANFNLVPLIKENEKKLYVITGYNGKKKVVVYGNDYLITFNSENKIKEVKKLHTSYLPIEYGDKEKQIVTAMHSHLKTSGAIMSATDICTTMLYQPYTNWESYIVRSTDYVSIWDCKAYDMQVFTNEEWDKISSEKEKK